MITVTYLKISGKRAKIPHYRRTFNYIVKHKDEYAKNTVVYIIWIGEKFYIGMANQYSRRVNAHISTINTFSWQPDIKTEDNYIWSKAIMRQHLMDNPEIEDIEFDLLEICDSEESAIDQERYWLLNICTMGLKDCCLNYDQVHSPTNGTSGSFIAGCGIDFIL